MWTQVPNSAIEEARWPAIPDPKAAQIFAMLYQFKRSECWPPELIRRRQFAQLKELLAHAYATVPFYREPLDRRGYRRAMHITEEWWRSLPILTRQQMQGDRDRLRSVAIPPSHGETVEIATSGSTGYPIRMHRTRLTDIPITAAHLRSLYWHDLDLSKTLCLITSIARYSREEQERAQYPHGIAGSQWLQPTHELYPTGPSALLDLHTAPEHQAEWLLRHRPAYLHTFPSNAAYLARHCRCHGIEMPWLEAVITTAEVVSPSLRRECREAFGADVIDLYACTEAGPLAAQCPHQDHHHIHAETVFLEVVDSAGDPCRPGEVGRVLITPLHNFATVLLRYELGDYAEVGVAGECEFGLPVLNRILGRKRQGLRLPDGGVIYPDLQGARYLDVAPVRRFQVAQTALDRLEVRLELRTRPTAAEEERLRKIVLLGLPGHFAIDFAYHDELPLSGSGKFEDFVCELED